MIDLANIEYHKKGKYLILRPSNNFGEYQDKTKFIPVILNSIMNKKKIPVYGEGKNEREWLYVGDTAEIVTQLVTEEHNSVDYFGRCTVSKHYLNLGSGVDLSNVELIKNICELLDTDANEHIEFVEDPRGNMHDLKYAVDSFKLSCIYDTSKIKSKFKENLRNTVWFLTHNH
jgi:dTDP-glucose 4,6-dehydratase